MTDYRAAIAGELRHDQTVVTDPLKYDTHGAAWCSFDGGSLWCVNGEDCRNPRHRGPVPTREFTPEPVRMWPYPCLDCGTVGRSGVTGLCPDCRTKSTYVENPG